jgi:hypothetical protein
MICRHLDDESETATEGEDEIRARELRKQEVRLKVPERPKGRQESDTGSDTEVKTQKLLTPCSKTEKQKNKNCALQ